VDFEFARPRGEQAADVPVAAGGGDDDLPAGGAEAGDGVGKGGIEFHAVDDRLDARFIGADGAKMPASASKWVIRPST
jgi:hypothetical protein